MFIPAAALDRKMEQAKRFPMNQQLRRVTPASNNLFNKISTLTTISFICPVAEECAVTERQNPRNCALGTPPSSRHLFETITVRWLCFITYISTKIALPEVDLIWSYYKLCQYGAPK